MKSFKKFFSVLFVCVLLSLTVCSDYISCYNLKASGGISDYVDNLLYYFLSVTGAINKPSDHSTSDHVHINPVPSTSRNALKQKIIDLINNNGIYESNGQYIFTTSAMDELYYILNGNSNSNFRVISDFTSFNVFGRPEFESYVNSTYIQNVADKISYYNSNDIPYIIRVYNSISTSSSTVNTRTFCNIYHFTTDNDFAFLSFNNTSSYDYSFYNNSGNRTTVLYDIIQCTYNGSSFTNTVNASSANYMEGNQISQSLTYSNFPLLDTSYSSTYFGYCTYYSPNSLLLVKSPNYASSAINQTSGIYYFNNYNFINVDNSVVNNNNWQSIYNSYTTNVSNTYNTEVTNNNGSDLTAKQIRQIMNTYLQPIYNAIDEGLTDIAEKVDYINEWLSKIYSNGSLIITRLDSIIQIIQQNTGGSGSTSGTACAWSDQEVDIVLDKLSRIYTEQVDNDLDVIAALEYIKTKISSLDTTLSSASSNISIISSNTSSIVTSLDTELSRLATVLTKMDTIISKMGQNRITRPTVDPNIIDDLEDLLPESVLDDIFSPFAALGSIIETVVPFCYIGVAVAIMSNLSAEAEAPYWEIPFKYDSDALALHIDEKLVIDLSPFEDLSTILRLLFIIAFTISLMFFSLPLVNYMTGIFSGK